MQRILVTGSEGVIGKILIDNLSSDFEAFGLDKMDIVVQRSKEYSRKYSPGDYL